MLKTVFKPPASKIGHPVHRLHQVNAYNAHDADGGSQN